MTVVSGAKARSESPRAAEWVGCFAVGTWAYCLLYPANEVVARHGVYLPTLVMLAFASLVATAVGCEDNTARLSRVALVLTPVAAISTAIMFLLPESAAMLCYAITALSLGPLLVRRLFGVIQAFGAEDGQAAVMPIVPAIFLFHTVWSTLPVPSEARFAALAVVGLIGLWRIEGVLPTRLDIIVKPLAMSLRTAPIIFAYVVFAVATDLCYQLTMMTIPVAWQGTHRLTWPLGILVTGVVAWVGAYVTHRNIARPWLIIAMAVVVAGLVISLTPGLQGYESIRMLTFGVGGGVTLFLMLMFWPYIVFVSRYTLLFSVLGPSYLAVRAVLLDVALRWLKSDPSWAGVLPPWFYVITLVLTIAVFFVSLAMLKQADARGLAEAIITILGPQQHVTDEGPLLSLANDMDYVDRKMIAMLVDGHKTDEIARALSVPIEAVEARIAAIRNSYLDPAVKRRADALAAVVAKFDLTSREEEVLRDICDGRSNPEIAQARFITERTVKFHIGNLLTKTGAADRRELRELVARSEEPSRFHA